MENSNSTSRFHFIVELSYMNIYLFQGYVPALLLRAVLLCLLKSAVDFGSRDAICLW